MLIIRKLMQSKEAKVKKTLYLPRKVFEVIAEMAKRKEKSLNEEIIYRLSRTLNEDLIHDRKKYQKAVIIKGDT